MRETPVTRRQLLAGAAGITASLGGCISTSPRPPGQAAAGGGGGGSSGLELLKAGGSSTLFPIVQTAASYWASNYKPTDMEYWGPSQYGIETDKRLSDYWGSKYGFEADGDVSPPFEVRVGLSHSGTGLEKLRNQQIDIGNSSAPVAAEFPEASEEELSGFTNHVVAVDAQPIIVSKEIYEAGVTKLTAEQVRGIYTGEITNWSQIDSYDGPEKEIQAVGRSEGSGTDTAFRTNMLGDPNASMEGVDARKGQNQQVKTTVSNSNNAIAYMALAFVDESVPAIELEFDGKTYTPGENLSDPSYPLARDLHCYTWEGTSKKEAAFLRMILSDFGQTNFVEPEGYSKLTDERQQTEIEKLAERDA
ncbi:PstS family phosphate ABC transporter substrate-binding protein [Halosimplex aquaticum]|uniref:PstS family phosphate ABC transporter substrate-binding protein n=1 Tax=Halosimplex aquaticum TaxID=3026162 RepID=A0ABD5Y431_9EURY|nr:PstS family phosphate ABC transporter substrate-binding protein [Halosimplex aquaticum]